MKFLDRFLFALGSFMWRKLEGPRRHALLRIDWIRTPIVRWRRDYFIRNGQLRKWDGDRANLITFSPGRSAIEYNLDGLHDIGGCRGLRIIRPLSVIETYRPLSEMPTRGGWFDLDYLCDAKVLNVGPRTEGEIFMLFGHGFRPGNVRGLDLFSYSPFIDVGDMHAMPYAEDSFDITILSCVLVYSVNPAQACQEVLRVTRNGGLVGIAQDTVPSAGIEALPALGKQMLYAEDYLALFAPHVKRVFYRHELPERLHELTGEDEGSNYTMALIFELDKSLAPA